MTLPDYHARAAEALQAEHAAYFLSGAGEGVTMRSNRRDFEAIGLRPQVLQDLRNGDSKLTLFGTQLAHPILVAPFAYQSLLDEGGETATAQGATAQEALMVLSAQSSQRMEDVRAQGGTCDWFQLYWQTNLDGT
ncbi:MAG: alpha-hydroxy-acid oxidizing protein, partial [Pseudomonadota bacterium]|nr:alpha-hydroxy-acid oxidizing protein [Pseudomonadota bacterium]